MLVKHVMKSPVVMVDQNISVREAAVVMNEAEIGSVMRVWIELKNNQSKLKKRIFAKPKRTHRREKENLDITSSLSQ